MPTRLRQTARSKPFPCPAPKAFFSASNGIRNGAGAKTKFRAPFLRRSVRLCAKGRANEPPSRGGIFRLAEVAPRGRGGMSRARHGRYCARQDSADQQIPERPQEWNAPAADLDIRPDG